MVQTNRYPWDGPECPQCGAALDKCVTPDCTGKVWHCWVCGHSEPRGDDYRMEDFAKMAGLKCDE